MRKSHSICCKIIQQRSTRSSRKSYDLDYFSKLADDTIKFEFFEARLTDKTVELANGFDAVCVFVNDQLDAKVLQQLAHFGVQAIALRCAGYNNLDLDSCKQLGLRAARVPAYSPEAVAEHTVALMMTLNRRLHKAYNRVKEDNFSLEGLLGFNIHGKTIGLIGTGRIGLATARIMVGFGAQVIASDISPNDKMAQDIGFSYVPLATLLQQADIISLHCPLDASTLHLINETALAQMKTGGMLINTSRGGLIDTKALISALKSRQLGAVALDVYEQESELFFEDHSSTIVQDDVIQRLLTFHNVLITGHQGFFTHEALSQITHITLQNLQTFASKQQVDNEL